MFSWAWLERRRRCPGRFHTNATGLEEIQRNLTVKVKPKPFKPLDDWLSTNQERSWPAWTAPLNLDFAGTHNLFNPVHWKKLPDGRLQPIRTGSEIGPGALKIAQIKELMLKVSFDAVLPASNPGEPPKYQVTVPAGERQ